MQLKQPNARMLYSRVQTILQRRRKPKQSLDIVSLGIINDGAPFGAFTLTGSGITVGSIRRQARACLFARNIARRVSYDYFSLPRLPAASGMV